MRAALCLAPGRTPRMDAEYARRSAADPQLLAIKTGAQIHSAR